jgi:hypothetical protein
MQRPGSDQRAEQHPYLVMAWSVRWRPVPLGE